MLAKLGHKVLRLKRIAIASILLDKLPKGKSRKVSARELEELKRIADGGSARASRVAQKEVETVEDDEEYLPEE